VDEDQKEFGVNRTHWIYNLDTAACSDQLLVWHAVEEMDHATKMTA
jgi:predicted metal-dependent hydrolase